MINVNDKLLDALNESEMFLLMHITRYMGRNGFGFPSNETLMENTKWSLPTLQRWKKSLIEKGLIRSEKRFRGSDGGQTSNAYYVETNDIGVFIGIGDAQKLVSPLSKNLAWGDTQIFSTHEVLKENEALKDNINTEPASPAPKKPTRHRAGDTPQLALPLDMSAPLTPESLLHLWNGFEGGKHKPQQLTKERTTQINKIIQGLSPTNDEAEYVVENYRLWSTTQGQDYDSLSNATRYDKFEKRLIDYREGRGKKRLGKVLSSGEESVALSSNPICF